MVDVQSETYSQQGEDEILARFFEGQEGGFFIDVGAFDGVRLSNTYLLELAGWLGVCIEAHPKYAALCRENRPGSTCIHGACIGDATQKRITLYTEPLGLLSSIRPRHKEVMRRYRKRGLTFPGFRRVEVPAVTLNGVLADLEVPSVDFVSIDVEGAEFWVLKGFDLEKYHPRIIVIETNTDASYFRINRYLTQARYHRARRMGSNVFYCARQSDALIIAGLL